MNDNHSRYQYAYLDSKPVHHHAYLLSPLLELLGDRSLKLRVLDLGCGNGSLTQAIAQQGHEVVGIDGSARGIEIAQTHFPNCRFLQASIYDLPYAELANSFDAVISAEVIEHLIYPRELLKAAKKCLKPDGKFILTTPYHGYWKNLAIALAGKMDSHFNPLWDGGHVKFFSVATMTSLLQAEGFMQLQFKFAGRFPLFWKSMLCSASLKPHP